MYGKFAVALVSSMGESSSPSLLVTSIKDRFGNSVKESHVEKE